MGLVYGRQVAKEIWEGMEPSISCGAPLQDCVCVCMQVINAILGLFCDHDLNDSKSGSNARLLHQQDYSQLYFAFMLSFLAF